MPRFREASRHGRGPLGHIVAAVIDSSDCEDSDTKISERAMIAANPMRCAAGAAARWAICVAAVAAAAAGSQAVWAEEWSPKQGRLMTRWAEDVSPESVHAEYPRPQMVRQAWQNLNGLWDYAVRPRGESQPAEYDGQILVPFAIESALSGVEKRVAADQRLWYRRTFSAPADWEDQTVLLHFGAVDWEAKVWVNGQNAGEHRGGYDPFSFDVTNLLEEGENEIVVSVWDPTDEGYQPRGKQTLNPHGIWYTPVTGIWQTVWLEPVPHHHIRSLRMVPEVDQAAVEITVAASQEATIRIEARDGETVVGRGEGQTGRPVTVKIDNPKLWSPDDPHLYDLKVEMAIGDQTVDHVESYCGLRKIEVKADSQGINRLFLNNEPVFQYGPLDQGWWPDGLYTAPTDEALRYDLEVTKEFGFNMTRKHVKVEPARWYYWCDKLGLLVWQDMPSGDGDPEWITDVDVEGPEIRRSAESAMDFRQELTEMVDDFYNHPSIVMWVPFNERWGQFDTEQIVALMRRLDPTRPINSASGGNFLGVGDVLDVHSYPDPAFPRTDPYMATVCGEFGGLGLPVEGHTWLDKGNWGYRTYETPEALTEAYLEKVAMLRPMIGKGMAAAVYTQITDVEIEVNGLLTYDRAVIKVDPETIAAANRKLYLPPPISRTVLEASNQQPQTWRYTTSEPGDGWEAAGFDASSWEEGPGGFGTEATPGAVVGTVWDSSDIWIRRSFEISEVPQGELQLWVHHDEDATIYLNGTRVAQLEGWTTGYTMIPLDDQARSLLKQGENVIAVHCHQETGGQFIDVGIVELVEQQ